MFYTSFQSKLSLLLYCPVIVCGRDLYSLETVISYRLYEKCGALSAGKTGEV